MRVFDLSEGGGYKCLLKCDVTKELERLVKKTTENSVGMCKQCNVNVEYKYVICALDVP